MSESLLVIVSGGGPVGLTFSIHLAMMMGNHVKILIYEGRWYVDQDGRIRWQGEEQGKTRRNQVVTLQDHVIDQMPEYIKTGLFQNIDERVWPTSRNIPIKEVEDRLFDLIQPFVRSGQIDLIPENLNEQSDCLIKGNFDILVGADGSNSFIRRYCNIQMISEGVEYACGVAYHIPNNIPPSEEPLQQNLNCVLTVSQTRYLVNSSTSRQGYLNIRLIRDEYDELKDYLEKFQSLNQPIDLLDFDKCPNSPVWGIIRQGLNFFKICQKYVFRVIPIEINVRHASIVVRELRYEIENNPNGPKVNSHRKQYKTALAFLAGDAAMCVHFWPGRGMNSGMKAAMALARNILRACSSNDLINIQKPLRFLDFLEYESFMARLRAREQQGRSLRVLIDPIDGSIDESYNYAHRPQCYQRYTTQLIRKLKESRQRLEANSQWPHKSNPITDDELQQAANRIEPYAVAQLSIANPWPTREMSGIEILVENTFPYELKTFLPVPNKTYLSLRRKPSVFTRSLFYTLWIVGDEKRERFEELIETISKSQALLGSQRNGDFDYRSAVTRTIEEATQWLQTNQPSITGTNSQLKIITSWSIEKDKTAINVIKTFRSILSRVPILIYTNKQDQIQVAQEFPNVTTTDNEFEVREFANVQQQQDSLWNIGCLVKNAQNTMVIIPEESATSNQASKSYDQSSFNLHEFSLIKGSNNDESTLLWIDSVDNDLRALKQIQEKHPSLKIEFRPTYSSAKEYLNENIHKIIKKKEFITVCHGYYKSESKSYMDIIQLYHDLQIDNKPIAIYTKNRKHLLEQTQQLPNGIEIFENSESLLAFISTHL